MPGPTAPLLGLAGGSADHLAVRRHNLALLVGHLRRHGARSRARLAAETGLNKATVSSLVTELMERGLLAEGAAERGAVGRPGLAVDLHPRALVALGAEIGVDHLAVLATDLRGTPLVEQRVALDAAGMTTQAVLERVAAEVGALAAPLVAAGSTPVGLTVAVPGLTDHESGSVRDAPNLGWHDQPVATPLSRLVGALLGGDADPWPVDVDNEANLAALAELDARADADPQELLLLTGGAGVGGGVVTGGRLLRGARGFAGELGHLQVDPEGLPCSCGRRGCLETVVSLPALLTLAAAAGDPVRDPDVDVLQRLEELRRRAEQGDARTLHALEEVGGHLLRGCASLVNVLNPEVVVLGGWFAVLGRWLAPTLERELAGHVCAPDAGGARIEVSTLGVSGAVRGAALRAAAAVLEDPTLAPLR
ncbi:ROK family transcriptional regulator [Nocardioides nanhaiensis]|uniref:ROK family transcriptional regulator n=1 Tax=Nocardioides nanhaiensis TaxID=1476871 RepID=A0ABP8WAN0_9ACTN